jgi:clan AA aspartic protease (TIGR02281 family)
MHCHLAWLAWLLVSLAASADSAPGKSPEELLADKGLRKLSSCFALADEAELTKSIRQVESLRRDLFDSQKELAQRKKAVDEKRKLMVSYMEQRRQLRAQLNETRSIDAHNRVVAALNEVGDRLVLLNDSKLEEQSLQAAVTKVGQLTDQYIEQVLKTREFYDQVNGKYQTLAADAAVKQALEAYNRAGQRAYSLGPSPTFLSNGRRLAKLEESVLSDTVEMHRSTGGLWQVTAVFNGTRSADMAVDTGASITVLPSRIAEDVGVKPTEDDQPVRLQLADGRVMTGKLVLVDRIRIGRFTVENVECAVMPPEMNEATALLGLSFFKHFNFKVDNSSGKLTLARVESGETGRPGPGTGR